VPACARRAQQALIKRSQGYAPKPTRSSSLSERT
jgi:hypothetical protein